MTTTLLCKSAILTVLSRCITLVSIYNLWAVRSEACRQYKFAYEIR